MTDKFGNFEFIFIILNSSSSDAFKFKLFHHIIFKFKNRFSI
ncbi:hypothetical protein J500_2936 [Acinetobacter sp. 479375]|nr:hypothetical protein J500_2936 [Acinetobacter sp. 479375]BBF77118.1 hypothetical protein URS_1097 [Acinetobacter ursingii]